MVINGIGDGSFELTLGLFLVVQSDDLMFEMKSVEGLD